MPSARPSKEETRKEETRKRHPSGPGPSGFLVLLNAGETLKNSAAPQTSESSLTSASLSTSVSGASAGQKGKLKNKNIQR
jgi:hypothetical protein